MNRLYVADLPDGTPRLLAADGSGAVSTCSGDRIAYLADADNAQEVFVLDAAGHAPRQVTRLSGTILSLEQFDGARSRLLVRRREPVTGDGADHAPVVIEHLPCVSDGTGLCGRAAQRLGIVDAGSGQYTACVSAGGDVSEESIDSVSAPTRIRWHEGTFIEIAASRGQ